MFIGEATKTNVIVFSLTRYVQEPIVEVNCRFIDIYSYLPNNSMEISQDDGLVSYLPNYSMETPLWAGYYHIYLIIVWRPHNGRVIIIFT
jgi:hypothetical protein